MFILERSKYGYYRMLELYRGYIFFVLILCCMDKCRCETVNKDLLRVAKGTGVSFLKLWDLKGYQINTANVFRSCIIDIPFTSDCPTNKGYQIETQNIYRSCITDIPFSVGCQQRVYFKLTNQSTQTFNLNYKEPFSNNSLWNFENKTPAAASYSIEKNFNLQITPNNEIICKGNDKSYPNKIFFAVTFKEGNSSYPKYYSVSSATSQSFQPSIKGFTESDSLTIFAKYDASCNLTNPCSTKSIAEIKNLLAQTTTTSKGTTTGLGNTATTSEDTSSFETTIGTEEGSTSLGTTTTTEEESTSLGTTTTTEEESTSLGTTTTTDEGTATTSNKVTTQDPTAEKMCPCDCEFKRRLEILSTNSDIPLEELKIQLAPEIEQLKKSLAVDVTKLASSRRKKISAGDKRKSSEQIGYVGAIIIAIVCGLVILIDIVAIKRFYRVFRRNVLGR